MFVNLMDLDLQDRIASTDKALELLLDSRPNSLRQDLEDWRLEKHGERNILFYKDRNYIPDWLTSTNKDKINNNEEYNNHMSRNCISWYLCHQHLDCYPNHLTQTIIYE